MIETPGPASSTRRTPWHAGVSRYQWLVLLVAWLGWVFDWPASWGVPNGPEVTLWAAVIGGMLITRTVAVMRSEADGG